MMGWITVNCNETVPKETGCGYPCLAKVEERGNCLVMYGFGSRNLK